MKRCTIQELALYYHMDNKPMERMLKRMGVDLSNIGSIIAFAEEMALSNSEIRVGRDLNVKKEQLG